MIEVLNAVFGPHGLAIAIVVGILLGIGVVIGAEVLSRRSRSRK
jgi:hypothetical protein